jgi:hypothetical protein
MPSQVRIIAGPRDSSFDHLIAAQLDQDGYGVPRTYFGIEQLERAKHVRNRLVNAGRHLGASVKAFWYECGGCDKGGGTCRYHIEFTSYDPAAARTYKQQQARRAH